ncbi:condensation domain-containing protein [Pedobacter sp. NJ-S-72]
MAEGDLFDSILVFENYPASKVVSESQDNVELQNVEMREQTNYPLSLIVSSGAVINVVLSYNSTLLEDTYAAAIAAHVEQVLRQLLVHETGTLADIELLTSAEQELLLKTFNNTETAYPHEQTAIGIFEAQVLRYPASPALVFENQVYTYQGIR